jgi:hypothetical protein
MNEEIHEEKEIQRETETKGIRLIAFWIWRFLK